MTVKADTVKYLHSQERIQNIMASDDVSRIELLLREHFTRTDRQISELRNNIYEMKIKVSAMENDIQRMKRDIGLIHDWDLWLIMAVVTVLVLPKIADGIKSIFTSITDAISAVARIFRKEDKA